MKDVIETMARECALGLGWGWPSQESDEVLNEYKSAIKRALLAAEAKGMKLVGRAD